MKNTLVSIGAIGVTLMGAMAFISTPVGAQASDLTDICAGTQNTGSPLCRDTMDGEKVVQTIINTLLYLVGMIAVIMIVYSGIRYTTSAGNQNAVTSAKNTLLYSVVGLVVAILAWTIVNWVYTRFV